MLVELNCILGETVHCYLGGVPPPFFFSAHLRIASPFFCFV